MSIRAQLEIQLNDFDPARRQAAFETLLQMVEDGDLSAPEPGRFFNLHCHSFFSYNGYGYSPIALAWKGRCEGLWAMGLVDFDVLDGVDEFLTACQAVGLRACAGIETRIFVPEFATRVINSPGEPGISYHMGVGFVTGAAREADLLREFKAVAQARNRSMVARINPHMAPVTLDYDADVLPLTPKGNPTERHVCMAYDAKAKALFPDPEARAAFWAEKLGVALPVVRECLENPAAFQGLIRARTMKSGGVGYVQPDGADFPRLDQLNQFSLANGAIPTMAWLDGTTPAEEALDELLDVMIRSGVAAVNIIPDRNWNIKNPEERKRKVQALHDFVRVADARCLPIFVGTEMNAPGQRFVDDFDAPELAPLYPAFLKGACIAHAHTLLQAHAGMGYLSEWAATNFGSVGQKNEFYAAVGRRYIHAQSGAFLTVNPARTRAEVERSLGLS